MKLSFSHCMTTPKLIIMVVDPESVHDTRDKSSWRISQFLEHPLLEMPFPALILRTFWSKVL